MRINNLLFKEIIVVFWTFWWLIALWTDGVGALAHLGYLKDTWAPDTNYPFLVASLKMYKAPGWIPVTAFLGILGWSVASVVAFVWASLGLHRGRAVWLPRAQVAFIISLTFWLAFFLADQFVMKFDLEQNHMVQGGFELLTFLTLYLLPERAH